MNPNSSYYLAINTGFPNEYDRANGRTGAFLMIHGDCASVGCYAMTDEQIAEIYALAREAFSRRPEVIPDPGLSISNDAAQHGEASQLATYGVLENAQRGLRPFRSHAPRPEGGCLREAICVRRRKLPGEFSPVDRCPIYKMPEDVAAAVRDKQRRDDVQTAELIDRARPPRGSRLAGKVV